MLSGLDARLSLSSSFFQTYAALTPVIPNFYLKLKDPFENLLKIKNVHIAPNMSIISKDLESSQLIHRLSLRNCHPQENYNLIQ